MSLPVPVHSVFKADPIKQTEPGHGRIVWKRVGEGWRGMDRDGEGWRGMERDGPWGHERRNTMGERAQPESQDGWWRGRRGFGDGVSGFTPMSGQKC